MVDNYYVGLDLGTNSIGWAATDENYNFLRLKGKTAFGSRLFSEANDSKKRRVFRSNRRRMQRRKNRVYLLNYLFAEELNKIDKTFLLRLSNSAYLIDDKNPIIESKHVIFSNVEEEKNFYRKYPTIFHLRRDLRNNEELAFSDLRYVYLAIHHIIKYRGNFLHEGDTSYSDIDDEILVNVNECLKGLKEEDFEENFITKDKFVEFKEIVLSDDLKTVKSKKLAKLFSNDDKDFKFIDLFTTLCVGGKFSLKKIFPSLDTESITLEDFDTKKDEYAQNLGDAFTLVLEAKKVYDFSLLNSLLGESQYLSDVMINIYNQHKNDLKLLKEVIKEIDRRQNHTQESNRLYTKIFKSKTEKKNYVAFIHQDSSEDRISLEDFNKELLKIINDNKADIEESNYNKIVSKLERNEFLRTIAHVSTSVIPHQLHKVELEKILDNAEKHFPFIPNIKDKIMAIFLFRVPYYSGPTKGEYSNFVRRSDEKIYPWNFNEIIDENETKKKFINKLTNKCKYIFNADVLPKSSLLYQEYMILDKLNVMNVNGSRLTLEEKKKIYDYISLRNKTTLSNLKTEFKNMFGSKASISCLDENLIFEATSLKAFKENFLDKDYDLMEKLIFMATIYADDKKALKTLLEKDYKNLSQKQRKTILSLPTKKWSPFSRELLEGIYALDDNGIAHSIISVMREENKNFQMVMFDEKYQFNVLIDQYNKELRGDVSNEEIIQQLLDDTPAKFRRSINQSLLILDDLVSITKKTPKKILIEVTREDLKNKNKKRTDSRKKELMNFLTSWKKDVSDYAEQAENILEELKEIDEAKLKGKHVYLYFKQLGYDLYTGEKIKLEEVLSSDKFDTDHIVPQSLIKDDSLDNLVLVDRNYNQKIKKDIYPIPNTIKTEKIKKFWEYLKNKKAISEIKYNKLMRNTELSQEELQEFVNSQINAINYSNKVLKDILEIKYPKAKLIFSKAQYPSYLRKKLNIAKLRELNDVHHAVDAYLNIISGNILTTTFSNRFDKHIKTEEKTFNMERVLDIKIKNNNLEEKIIQNCLRHDALVTYKCDYHNGEFYKQTIYKATGEKNSLIPLHTKDNNPLKDVSKYGGYSDLKSSKMAVIEYEEKGKKYKRIENVKLMYEKLYSQDTQVYLDSIYRNEKANNIKLVRYIPNNQKVEFGGGIYTICTSNENQFKLKMAYQNYLSNENIAYFNFAYKRINDLPENLDSIEIKKDRKEESNIIISKEKNYLVFQELINNANKKVYDSCNYIVKIRNISDKDFFMKFNLKEQIQIIFEVIKMFSRSSDLSKLLNFYKESSNGKLLISKNITDKKIKLIYESPTGLYTYKKDI